MRKRRSSGSGTSMGGRWASASATSAGTQITPPSIIVSCTYPGASSKVVADTVAAPIEQQVIGVENMLYMSSQSTNDGGYKLTVTFEVGTNLDMAQVLVQNRVSAALAQLPQSVQQQGVVLLDEQQVAEHLAVDRKSVV